MEEACDLNISKLEAKGTCQPQQINQTLSPNTQRLESENVSFLESSLEISRITAQ